MIDYIASIRSTIGHDLLLLPTTAVILLNDRDEVLMQCRSDNHMWSCPGGILDIGETVRENAVREAAEETGLVVERWEFFGVFAGPDFFYTYPNGDETAIVQSVFLTRHYSGLPRVDAESIELRFFPATDLPSPLTPTHAGFLRHLPAYLRGDIELPIVE